MPCIPHSLSPQGPDGPLPQSFRQPAPRFVVAASGVFSRRIGGPAWADPHGRRWDRKLPQGSLYFYKQNMWIFRFFMSLTSMSGGEG